MSYQLILLEEPIIVCKEEITNKAELNTTDLYYVKNHYNEWYIGKYNDKTQEFEFVGDQGTFSANLFKAKKIIAGHEGLCEGLSIIDFGKFQEELEIIFPITLAETFIKTKLRKSSQAIGIFFGFVEGFRKALSVKKRYTEEDMIKAAKYGYEFRDTTSFPEHKFEDSCINNFKQNIALISQPKQFDITIFSDDGVIKILSIN